MQPPMPALRRLHALPTGASRRLAAALLLVGGSALVFTVLDAVARTLRPPPHRPFACSPAPGLAGARLYFKGRLVIQPTAAGREEPLSCASPGAAAALNGLFQLVRRPPGLEVVSSPDGGALVLAGRTLVVQASPGAGDPQVTARQWADELQTLLRAKGWPKDGCPECHAERPVDMRNAAR